MQVSAEYLGMPVDLFEGDTENLTYFKYCAAHAFHLQKCQDCSLLRYPPTTACPWCACPRSTWQPVEGRGTVHSYIEVHHAIQPAFKPFLPYLVLLVELDTQKGLPDEHCALRVMGNLAKPDGTLASREEVEKVGIGSRVRMVFSDVNSDLSIPQWTLDDEQPNEVWRY